jgi:voltage-gated sodium channel
LFEHFPKPSTEDQSSIIVGDELVLAMPPEKTTSSGSIGAVDEDVYTSPAAAAVGRLMHNHFFESGMSCVIMFNMVLIIVETDYAAHNDDSLPWAEVVGWLILVLFLIELTLRLFALRMAFWRDNWNTFDFVIVMTDSVFSFLGLILGDVFPVSTLRIFRLCKLARISKVFRVFPELRIMMAGLIGSFRAIFWGTVLLAFVLLVWAIIAVQFIHPLNKELEESGALAGCERCPRAYSSVMHASLTMIQQIVTGDSWGQATIPLIEAYPQTALYFMGVFLSVGFAVMNLILGVVVNVAQTEHDNLKKIIEDEEGFKKMEGRDLLLEICSDMDKDGSGELTKQELIVGFRERDDFRQAIMGMNLREDDLAIAFSSMDPDKSGTVTYIELVKKLFQMKDTDSAFLLEQIKFYLMQCRDLMVDQWSLDLSGIGIASPGRQEKASSVLDTIVSAEVSVIGITTNMDITPEKEPKALPQSQLQVTDDAKGKEALRLAGCTEPLWQEVTGDYSVSQPMQTAAAVDFQKSDQVLEALSNLCKLFKEDFRDALRRIESGNEQQATNTSQILSQLMLQRSPDDLVPVPRNLGSAMTPSGMCCSRA